MKVKEESEKAGLKLNIKKTKIMESGPITSWQIDGETVGKKAMFFSVAMYGCESWTIKKFECRRIDAFELWCWRRLEGPLDCKVIKPVNPKGNKP